MNQLPFSIKLSYPNLILLASLYSIGCVPFSPNPFLYTNLDGPFPFK